eukprot:SAG31_NODE_2317_length_5947_cov_2.753591_4_plen_34_part_00
MLEENASLLKMGTLGKIQRQKLLKQHAVWIDDE